VSSLVERIIVPKPKTFVVWLEPDQRAGLVKLVSTGIHPVAMVRRARVLLELDQHQGPVDDCQVIGARVGISENTVCRVARQFVDTGGDVDQVIQRKKRLKGPIPLKVTGDVEARVIAKACSPVPQGHDRWTLRLLEKQIALTDEIPDLDHSTIGNILKKHHFALI
jgi:transposase